MEALHASVGGFMVAAHRALALVLIALAAPARARWQHRRGVLALRIDGTIGPATATTSIAAWHAQPTPAPG